MEQRECFTDEEELNIYIDGELGNDRTMILNEHVRSCDDCSIRYRIASGLKSRVREACAEIRAPVWLRTRIMSDMERESAAGGGGFWVYLINRFRSRPLIPVGAVGLLVVLFLVAVFSNPRDGGTMPLVREMIHEHYEYMEGSLENGIESSDPEEITSFIRVNGGIEFLFSSDAMPPPNSACVLKEHGETVGYVSFDYLDRKISLFMIKDKEESLYGPQKVDLENVSMFCGKCTGMNYVLWQGQKMVCVLVGDLPQESLVDLAGLMI
jgi:hypothetical protein